MAGAEPTEILLETPLAALHRELGAKMVPFAGYAMPVQYPDGILAEHLHTRSAAGLFDVSHMGQAALAGPDHATTAAALEALTPGDFQSIGHGRQRYTVLLNDDGGIVDDLMVARSWAADDDGVLALVVNAARKAVDYDYILRRLPAGVSLATFDRALLALQGPLAVTVVARFVPEAAAMGFMTAGPGRIAGIDCALTRSGYTGEDGFEISVASEDAEALARVLLAEPEVKPIGLGARDSLRLEAGLPLYGHDIDETTSPIEADLGFAVAKRRRETGGFPGASRILRELAEGTARRRVGLRPDGRAPAREGTAVLDDAGAPVGTVTSGGFGPSVGGPVAMGYVPSALAAPGTAVALSVRGKALPAMVAAMPFVPHRYFRKKS